MRKRAISLSLILMMLTTACSGTAQENSQEVDFSTKQEISWEINYEVPTCTASVLVDQEGYYTTRDKIVCFRGKEHGTTFNIVDTTTKETVFTGYITGEKMDQESGEYVSQGDFTEFTTPGTYYIETDVIGRSYSFQICEDTYDTLFSHMLEKSIFYPYDAVNTQVEDTQISMMDYQQQSNRKDVYEESMAITAQALEMIYYGDCFEQEDGTALNVIKDMQQEAAWLLSMQQDNGDVYAGLYIPSEGTICRAPTSDEATVAFCGSMALLSEIFETSDPEMAVAYKTAAEKSWNQIQQSETVSETERFFAAAWLFWLDGNRSYQTIATSYLEENELKIIGDRFSLYGGLAYISAEYKTDTTICANIMRTFMESAEETATTMKKQSYLVYSGDMEENFERILIVSIANYVVPSNEYVRVIENFMHYLLGRNKNGYRYIFEDGCLASTTDAITKTQQWNAIIRFMMCSILDTENENSTENF